MRNVGLEAAQDGIKIARRNINNLRYADDTTLMAESEEELKSLLMKVKVETTGKSTALTRWNFVGKVMSLLLNMLSRLVITFLPRNKHFLILWLQSSFAVILEPQNIKSLTVSIVSPSICHEVMGPDAMIFVF